MIKPNILLISVLIAMPIMGMTMISPSLPLIKEDLGSSFSDTQMVLSIYFLFLAVGQLFAGPLSDRFGRKPLVIYGSLIFSFSSLACSFSNDFSVLIFLRTIQGIGAAACFAVGRNIISDSFNRSEAASKMSTVTAYMVVLPILCFVFGGMLAEYFGWHSNFIALFLIGIVIFLLLNRSLKETLKLMSKDISILRILENYIIIFKNKWFICFSIIGGMQTGMYYSMNGFMPYEYLRLGASASEFGLWFSLTSVGYIFGNLINSKYTIKIGLEKMCLYGTILSLIFIFVLIILNLIEVQSIFFLTFICLLKGFSHGFIVANAMIGAINSVSENQGASSGLMGALQVGFGGLAGYLIIYFGGANIFLISLIGILIMSTISIFSSIIVNIIKISN